MKEFLCFDSLEKIKPLLKIRFPSMRNFSFKEKHEIKLTAAKKYNSFEMFKYKSLL